jgi:hypothetical protein
MSFDLTAYWLKFLLASNCLHCLRVSGLGPASHRIDIRIRPDAPRYVTAPGSQVWATNVLQNTFGRYWELHCILQPHFEWAAAAVSPLHA